MLSSGANAGRQEDFFTSVSDAKLGRKKRGKKRRQNSIYVTKDRKQNKKLINRRICWKTKQRKTIK